MLASSGNRRRARSFVVSSTESFSSISGSGSCFCVSTGTGADCEDLLAETLETGITGVETKANDTELVSRVGKNVCGGCQLVEDEPMAASISSPLELSAPAQNLNDPGAENGVSQLGETHG